MECEGTDMPVGFLHVIEWGAINLVNGPACQICGQDVVPEDGRLLAPVHQWGRPEKTRQVFVSKKVSSMVPIGFFEQVTA